MISTPPPNVYIGEIHLDFTPKDTIFIPITIEGEEIILEYTPEHER